MSPRVPPTRGISPLCRDGVCRLNQFPRCCTRWAGRGEGTGGTGVISSPELGSSQAAPLPQRSAAPALVPNGPDVAFAGCSSARPSPFFPAGESRPLIQAKEVDGGNIRQHQPGRIPRPRTGWKSKGKVYFLPLEFHRRRASPVPGRLRAGRAPVLPTSPGGGASSAQVLPPQRRSGTGQGALFPGPCLGSSCGLSPTAHSFP